MIKTFSVVNTDSTISVIQADYFQIWDGYVRFFTRYEEEIEEGFFFKKKKTVSISRMSACFKSPISVIEQE